MVNGTTENAIKSRLGDYGSVLKIRCEVVHSIGISTYSVQMDLKKLIPSPLVIANFPTGVRCSSVFAASRLGTF